jgi:DNA modification methylase
LPIQLLTGDCRDVLPTLASNSVHCVVTSPPYYALRSYLDASHPDKHREIGSEPTPDAYIATMVAVFREVRRILRNDGVMFLNVGDSYSSGARMTQCDPSGNTGTATLADGGARRAPAGVAKPKDLLMMPARLALALQADGWFIRSDIIWHKPNPMPESCTDRPTSAHEHVFLLTKRARYFWDAEAVREEAEYGRRDASGSWRGAAYLNQSGAQDNGVSNGVSGSITGKHPETGRNLRNVWTIATAPYAEAHFATYPPALVERCIRAGTSERGACAACGAPYTRITERSVAFTSGSGKTGNVPNGKHAGAVQALSGDYDIRMGPSVATTTTGWRASCQCNAETQPCTVLDPFLGSGTTALVADRLQRHCVGIDLNTTYADLARNRVTDDCPLFTSWAPAEDPEERAMRDLFAEAAE